MYKLTRIFQIILMFVAIWFVYWGHIDPMFFNEAILIDTFSNNITSVIVYSVAILAAILIELREKVQVQSNKNINSDHSDSQLNETYPIQKDNMSSKNIPLNTRRIPSKIIGIFVIFGGALILAASIIGASSPLAFIGLSLTFWGILLLFVSPIKFVNSSVLVANSLSQYATIDRIVEEFDYISKPIYLPSYSKDAYLSEYMGKLNESVIFLSANDDVSFPHFEVMAKHFVTKNPEGVCISSPGFGLLRLFEEEAKFDFASIDLDDLSDILSELITVKFELANGFEMQLDNDVLHVKIVNSIYKDLYSESNKLKSIYFIGCPLASSVASAAAKTIGKVLKSSSSKISRDLKTFEVWYKIIEG